MDKSPLVSVLMTAYNREKYIGAAIESVMESHFTDWELIIVDDQSRDRTVEIAQDYASKDKRIKVYVNEKNLGDYPNRNKAASYAKGEFLKYLDADDLMYPYCLDIMLDAMRFFPEAAMALSQNIINDKAPYPILSLPNQTAKENFLGGIPISVGPSSAIIRRQIFEKLGGFSTEQYVGDTELWMRISFQYPIIKLQPSLIWWRIHDEQQMAYEQKDFRVANKRYAMNKIAIRDFKTPLDEEDRILAEKKLNRRLIMNTIRMGIYKGKISVATQMLKNSGIGVSDVFKAIFH